MTKGVAVKLSAKWHSLSLFWKIYIILVVLLGIIVTVVEIIAETLLEPSLKQWAGMPLEYSELLLWCIGILLPTLLVGQILSSYLNRKFESIAKGTEQIVKGDLSTRLDVENSGDALGKMTNSFNMMAEGLQRMVQNERRLLADISHELRSPLTRLALAVELAGREATPKTSSYLQRMQNEVERMNDLVTLLLEHGRNTLTYNDQHELVDMTKLLTSIADNLAFQGSPFEITVDCKIQDNLFLRGNAIQLQTLISNVTQNALNNSSPGSQILLSSLENNGELIISIRDFGPGVPADKLEDIFRAFYQVEDSRVRRNGGAGLGLAIAKQVAISHGGSITATNAQPGLNVMIHLPLKQNTY